MFAVEYFCPFCKNEHDGRFFKKPDGTDLANYEIAKNRWDNTQPTYVPTDEIPAGDETNRLHRWGYRQYRELFNARQLLGLEASARLIAECRDDGPRKALATNLSDLLRYQNMLCRYDAMALKSLDVFSVHGFPVGLVQCESNLLGISGRRVGKGQGRLFASPDFDRGPVVGSGGWANIVEKYARAKAYCAAPFEVRHRSGKKVVVPTLGEWIGDSPLNGAGEARSVDLRCESSTDCDLAPSSFDAVLTDPPYFGNVQYAELIDFCYVWLRRLVHEDVFSVASTRNIQELTGNVTLERDLTHFAEGLSKVFQRVARALKPGGPLVFTYHHNSLEAYYPLAAAILDSGLACTAALPCPGEMTASVHINGTTSSVIDTIFVCRSSPGIAERHSSELLLSAVERDVALLKAGGLAPTTGDVRCVTFGHLTRWAIAELRRPWDSAQPMTVKLQHLATWSLSRHAALLLGKVGSFAKVRIGKSRAGEADADISV